MYNERVAYVKSCLKGSYFVLATDGWTSGSTQSYVTVIFSYLTEDWTLKSFVLQTKELPESHWSKLCESVTGRGFWKGRSEIVTLVTTNAANMEIAAKEAVCTRHIGCYAHTFNFAAQKALKVDAVSCILARVRPVVSVFFFTEPPRQLLC